MAESYPALAEMRSSGIVKAIGVGMTDCVNYFASRKRVTLTVFCWPVAIRSWIRVLWRNFFRTAMSTTSASSWAVRTTAVSWLLTSDQMLSMTIVSPPEILEKARRIRDVCARYNVPLKAAALQFVLAHPAVTSVIPGSSYPEHVHENVAMIQYDIPSDLWDDLRSEGLIDETAHSLGLQLALSALSVIRRVCDREEVN